MWRNFTKKEENMGFSAFELPMVALMPSAIPHTTKVACLHARIMKIIVMGTLDKCPILFIHFTRKEKTKFHNVLS